MNTEEESLKSESFNTVSGTEHLNFKINSPYFRPLHN